MALNTHRHLELYYGVTGIGATLHPINVRLSPQHIVYTIRHAGDKILFVDDTLMPLLGGIYDQIRDVVETVVYIVGQAGAAADADPRHHRVRDAARPPGRYLRLARAARGRQRHAVLHHRHHRTAERRDVSRTASCTC
ncbi:hypothetical protein ACU4GD_04830 [Cupriavidus basilensis]